MSRPVALALAAWSLVAPALVVALPASSALPASPALPDTPPAVPAPDPKSACCSYADGSWQCAGAYLNGQWSCEAPVTTLPMLGNYVNRDDAACGAVLIHSYNMPLHIGSVFIVLVTSAIGVLLPITLGWWSRRGGRSATKNVAVLNIDAASFGRRYGLWVCFFFIARHFGTGVILSTSFIHLLYEGFAMFTDPCLGELHFAPAAAAIALGSALLTFTLDYVGSRAAAKFTVGKSADGSDSDPEMEVPTAVPSLAGPDTEDPETGKPHKLAKKEASTSAPLPSAASQPAPPVAVSQPVPHDCSHAEALFQQQEAWQVFLLEAGIVFHSIMVGVTLGAGSGSGWSTLLIVIVFHQGFEGAALGSRIAVLHWLSRARVAAYAAAFSFVTPIGIAIGIGVRHLFSESGKVSLLVVGVLNSFSAGILLYTSFKLLSADFIDGPLRSARPLRVAVAFGSLLAGAFLMSLLGKWV